MTSRSAALARPVISPMVLGRNGIGRFSRGSNRPSASSSLRSRSMRASSSPTPTARISLTRNENVPRPMKKFGLPSMITWVPSESLHRGIQHQVTGAGHRQRHVGGGSRSMMNAVLVFGRSVELGDLALDPDGAELVDPVLDHHRDGCGPDTGCPRTGPGSSALTWRSRG